MNRNLVIVRAGDASLHPGFLGEEKDRNWDIIVSYYDKDPGLYRDRGQKRIDSTQLQFKALQDVLLDLGPAFGGYEFVWILADDLVIKPGDLNRFFDICGEFALDLAQPSLSHDSIIGHTITAHNKSFRLRYTTYVESMAVCFSSSFLKKCLSSFTLNKTGYGLDYLWSSWSDHLSKVAIVDEIAVRHTRARGPLYSLFKDKGVDPELELRELFAAQNLRPVQMTVGGVDLEGELHAIWNNGHQKLIEKLLIGYLPELANYPEIIFKSFSMLLPLMGKSPADAVGQLTREQFN